MATFGDVPDFFVSTHTDECFLFFTGPFLGTCHLLH